MTTPQAALVEALAEAEDYLRHCANSPALADRCRAAIAQAEAAQPVAWLHPDGRVVPAATMASARRDGGAMLSSLAGYTVPLYAAPQPAEAAPKQEAVAPAKRALPWVRDGDKACGYNNWVAETPLGRILITWKGWKEDHYATVDEFPGAALGVVGDPDELRDLAESEFWSRVDALAAQPQQPAPEPVARVPLTHMQIVLLWGHRSDGPSTPEIVSFARAVERAHGIAAPQTPATTGDTEGRA